MKIICVDNYAREHIADKLIEEGITDKEAGKQKVDKLNEEAKGSENWYRLVEDNYRLSRGMEDLV